MVDEGELIFDEDRPTDYVTPVLHAVNDGDYTSARKLLGEAPLDKQAAIRRTVAIKTQISL